jgi:hypothetical protein
MDWHNTLSPALRDLVVPERLPPLGPGTPDKEAFARLHALTLDNAFAPLAVRDRDMAQCCLAGAWLLYNYLDEAHRISQDIDTATGGFWHGIMHRREPDSSNAAYWFRRVGNHPVFEPLAKDAESLGLRLGSGRWNPFDFIDCCEKHRDTGTPEETLVRRVQQREWELLFAWCVQRAVAQD